ncbi:MAG: ornithine cyclodeaminase family protein [Gammaproteobacteria bacterium]
MSLKGKTIATIPHISFDDVDTHLTWSGIADAIHDGHKLARAIHEDVYLQHEDKGFFNRSAFVPGLGLAHKSVTVFPGNRQATPPSPSVQGAVLLFEDDGGKLLAVLDGELVTKWKTTGDSILASRLLARPESKHLVVVGAGTVGGYAIDAFCELYPKLEHISIWNRSHETAERLAADNQHRHPKIVATRDLPGAVAQADIISSATMSPTAVLEGAWVKPGCHVDLIGAFLPHMREADDALLLASKVFVDSRRSTFEDIGEIGIPLSEGTITESHILGDYYDLCNGLEFKREPNDITFFKNGGGGHLDLMCARHIYKTYLEKNQSAKHSKFVT